MLNQNQAEIVGFHYIASKTALGLHNKLGLKVNSIPGLSDIATVGAEYILVRAKSFVETSHDILRLISRPYFESVERICDGAGCMSSFDGTKEKPGDQNIGFGYNFQNGNEFLEPSQTIPFGSTIWKTAKKFGNSQKDLYIATIRIDSYEAGIISYIMVHKDCVEDVREYILNIEEELYSSINTNTIPLLPKSIKDQILDYTINFLENCTKMSKYNVKMTKGIIFHGAPGTGKSMMVRHIFKKARGMGYKTGYATTKTFQSMAGRDELAAFFNDNHLVVLDDLDISYMKNRQENGSNNAEASNLLSLLDGTAGDSMNLESQESHLLNDLAYDKNESDMSNPIEEIAKIQNISSASNASFLRKQRLSSKGRVRIITTNEDTNNLDPAFIRAGRIDTIFTFAPPKEDILRQYISEFWDKEILDSIDVEKIVQYAREEDFNLPFSQYEELKALLVQHKVSDEKNGWDLDHVLTKLRKRRKKIEQPLKPAQEPPSTFGFASATSHAKNLTTATNEVLSEGEE